VDRLCESVRETFESCCELRAKLPASKLPASAVEDGGDASAERVDEQVEWGHQVSAADDFNTSLPLLLESRKSVLSSRGPDAPAAESWGESLNVVWNASALNVAERQLLSFAALDAMGVKERMQV
jgi:hypothetical protein|tara:strand:- start:2221 stop:2595 length:375 start_codon:yes stop_codon:yes gene_type:complete